MKQEILIKDPFDEKEKFTGTLKEAMKVKVKFNFPLASPTFDSSIALKKAKEEKSYIYFESQSQIDINTASNFYEAGKIYDVSEEFYKKFSEREVETYNQLFGNFGGKSKKLAQRPVVPFILRLDSDGNYLDRDDRNLDLYAKED